MAPPSTLKRSLENSRSLPRLTMNARRGADTARPPAVSPRTALVRVYALLPRRRSPGSRSGRHQNNRHRLEILSIHQLHFGRAPGRNRAPGRGARGPGASVRRARAGPESARPGSARPGSPRQWGAGPGEAETRRPGRPGGAASHLRSALSSRLATAPRAQPIARSRRGYPRALTDSNPGAGGGHGGGSHCARAAARTCPARICARARALAR